MELNDGCSPDLSNDRRQQRLLMASSIGQFFYSSIQGLRSKLLCPLANSLRDPALAFAHPVANLVELTGIEPVTSCLQSRRSPN
jgi:hypothetical protein